MRLNILLFLLYFVALIAINSCKKDEVKLTPVSISPETSTIDEGFKRKLIKIKFSSPISKSDSLQIQINTSAAIYGSDFTTNPISKDNVITLFAAQGDTVLTFQVSANLDADSDPNETVSFSFKKLPSGYGPDQISNTASVTIINNTLYSGLIGEYLFDGNSIDTSPSQNNGTVHEAIVCPDHLNSGNYAYSFDGINDYVSVPSTSDLNFDNSDFTVSVWASVSFPQESPSNGIFDIVRKWSGDAQGYPFGISFINDQAASHLNTFAVERYDGSACYHAVDLRSGPINSTGYHHIVEVKSGLLVQLFIDGNKISEMTDPTTCGETSTSQVTVGCRGQLARFFKGSIDDLRFYNRALTQDEINILFKI